MLRRLPKVQKALMCHGLATSITRGGHYYLLQRRAFSPDRILDSCKTRANFITECFGLDLNLIGASTHVCNFAIHRFYAVQGSPNTLRLLQNCRGVHRDCALIGLSKSVLND